MSKLSIMDHLDTTGMSEEDVNRFKSIDAVLGKAFDSAFESGMKSIDPETIKAGVIDAIKGMDEFKKEDLSAFVDSKAFNDKIKDISDELLSLKSKLDKGFSGNGNVKSLTDQVRDHLKEFVTIENGREVVDLKSACRNSPGNKKSFDIVMGTKAAITSAGAPHWGVVTDPDLDVEPRSESVIRRYASVSNIGGRSIVIAEFVPGTGDAEWVPEGGLKPAMDAEIQERTITVGKVALTAKITEEALHDLPQLVEEIRTEIIYRIGIREEIGILEGTGANGEIVGVMDDIPGFALTGLTVENPNKYDAIVAAYTQIISQSNGMYKPNIVMVNPIDYADMQLEKDANGQYLRPFQMNDELVSGLRVVTSTAIAQGEFLMGDFRYLNIRDYVALTITFGWENDDFTRNLVTMIGEKRLMAYIKRQYSTAFVHDTYANVITAITAPAAP